MLLLLCFSLGSASCFCWRTIETNRRTYFTRVACKDDELVRECEKNKHELEDYAAGFYSAFRDLMLTADYGQKSTNWVSHNRDALTYAIEKRPQPDCTTGTFTDTPIEPGSFYCYSPLLVAQCPLLLTNASLWQSNIASYMDTRGADNELSQKMQERADNVNSLALTCTTTQHVIDTDEYEAEDEPSCFTNQDWVYVRTPAGVAPRFMINLKPGDWVLTGTHWEPVYEISHRDPNAKVDIVTITVENQLAQIEMTPKHAIPVRRFNVLNHSTEETVFAEEVKRGDWVFVWNTNELWLEPKKVVKVEYKGGQGIYAPMTYSGTLIVNDVKVSCYANIKLHSVSGMLRWPRYLYRTWIQEQTLESKEEKVDPHWIEMHAFALAHALLPSWVQK